MRSAAHGGENDFAAALRDTKKCVQYFALNRDSATVEDAANLQQCLTKAKTAVAKCLTEAFASCHKIKTRHNGKQGPMEEGQQT